MAKLIWTKRMLRNLKDRKGTGFVVMPAWNFLKLTISDRSPSEWIELFADEIAPLEFYNDLAEDGTILVGAPFLKIDIDSGEVLDHEGRHRAAALIEAANDRYVPLLVGVILYKGGIPVRDAKPEDIPIFLTGQFRPVVVSRHEDLDPKYWGEFSIEDAMKEKRDNPIVGYHPDLMPEERKFPELDKVRAKLEAVNTVLEGFDAGYADTRLSTSEKEEMLKPLIEVGLDRIVDKIVESRDYYNDRPLPCYMIRQYLRQEKYRLRSIVEDLQREADFYAPNEEGETPVFVPLHELSDEEIVSLPRKAFLDEEFSALPKRLRDAVHKNDPASAERIELLTDHLDTYAPENNGDYYRERAEEEWEGFVNHYADLGDLLSLVEIDPEDFVGDEEALREGLTDSDNYSLDLGTYGDFVSSDEDEVYIPFSSFYRDMVYEGEYYIDEVKEAIDRSDFEKYELDEDEMLEAIRDGNEVTAWVSIPQFSISVDKENLQHLAQGDPEPYLPEEERIVFDKRSPSGGFYVVDLHSTELPEEGAQMGMCVGDASYEYISGVREGSLKILSMRKPNGKPRFTFEVSGRFEPGEPLDPMDDIAKIKQIKGKGNRLPGFRGGHKFNKQEARDVLSVINWIGEDPENVADFEPALKALRGEIKKSPPTTEEIMDELGRRQNPSGKRCKHCGGPAIGFCSPTRKL